MITRKFRVTVDGETFEVEVEEIGQAAAGETVATASPPGPALRQVLTVPPAAPAGRAGARTGRAQPTGGERVDAPLPGTIVSVVVKPGQEVKTGAVLVVLEAMKMQNEIVSPRDGKVREVVVGRGDSVAVGDPLVTLE